MNKDHKKRFYEDKPFKEGDKERCSSRIDEAEGRKTYISFLLNEKAKGTKNERYEYIIMYAKY